MATLEAQNFKTLELLKDSTSQAINIRLESVSFVKNNEFDSDFTDGFTGIGFTFKPTLEYWATQGTRINAGVFLQKYSGQDDFFKTIPIFTVQQKLTQDLDLVLGSIYGNLNHDLDEPLYRVDNFYQDNVEYGLQLLWQKPKIRSDFWIAWNQFILRGDSFQEQWTAGANVEYELLKYASLKLSIPFQTMLFHYGGEIDTSPDPVLSILNTKIGLRLTHTLSENTSWQFDQALYIYNGLNLPETGVHAQAFDQGYAIYLKAYLNHKNLAFNLAYWYADSFIAPMGEYLLLNQGEFGVTNAVDSKSFLNAGFRIHKDIKKNMRLEFDVRGYFDLDNQKFSHAMGLYFFMNDVFGIGKVGNVIDQ